MLMDMQATLPALTRTDGANSFEVDNPFRWEISRGDAPIKGVSPSRLIVSVRDVGQWAAVQVRCTVNLQDAPAEDRYLITDAFVARGQALFANDDLSSSGWRTAFHALIENGF